VPVQYCVHDTKIELGLYLVRYYTLVKLAKSHHFFTRRSLVRAKGEVFVLLYVFFCLFLSASLYFSKRGAY